MPRYEVRLLMEVQADNPVGAAAEFIENVVASGLRDFIYRVDSDTETLYVSGSGAVYTPAELEEYVSSADAEPPQDDPLLAEATELTQDEPA
jgi:hypothetical protein